ncbi:HipA domain-containing protein [Acinetobacter lwoffii]|uniref:HipA domain-containing protein n=1 Tax=Acinetobacter lwoffii TaxID=28090 RepID=A0AAW8AS30_ACILW|nr:HipA domain-containing protein [Acinetobacter lwoffii]MCO8097577.1 HipA domain-containing protein [Acinetobacter lwoffii]MCU4614080.1 HipA domain-containing protein [Acinetobacter lwoffii]MDP1369786.1 HipA domain-containing protein [Acinetobacter lwoffii]MDP1389200.1 HipA domain-containing protein [Acinetobacter lwoffii]MDP1448182.1 HipA domain-containing protein [Acinetobacter lwoffii]
MDQYCTLQIYQEDEWLDCAIVEIVGQQQTGWQAATRTSYLFEYAISYMNLSDGHALAYHLPVNVQNTLQSTWPAFLMDLLPQGYGRKELLRQLNFSENTQEQADWALLKAGAGNPIGNLRIKEAYEWLQGQFPVQQNHGFSLDQVVERQENFIESLASYGLFIAGSSGIQGEWPKLLLTQGHDDLFYLDHTLTDHQVKQHWLVKFSRGSDQNLDKILMHEALYMKIAQYLGLRVHQELELHGKTLFIPRFDRKVSDGKVERIAQESIASLGGKAGFGVRMTHNQICSLLMQCCTEPKQEIFEYLKRDLANVALGNKDNHTRNTAIQRFNNGIIQLTPLFDFAPMWLHPDGIARTTRWERDDHGGMPIWHSVIEQIAESTMIDPQEIKAVLIEQLPLYQGLLEHMQHLQLAPEILENSQYRIDNICQQLEELNYG